MESVRQGGTGAALTDGALKTFPFITYTTFLVFFFLVSIVALNVLVGLTVDDIWNFLENADLVKFSLRRQWILGKWEEKEDLITKQLNLEASATSDLVARYQSATSDLISKVKNLGEN